MKFSDHVSLDLFLIIFEFEILYEMHFINIGFQIKKKIFNILNFTSYKRNLVLKKSKLVLNSLKVRYFTLGYTTVLL